MRRDIFYIVVILVLLAAAIFFWHKAQELSYRLELIQERIEETKKELAEARKPKGPDFKSKVAIVIDDLGYNLNNVTEIWSLGAPVTLSILPNLPYSRTIAEAARDKEFETILHLPLEPYESFRLERETIMTEMEDERIKEVLERAISSVPGLKGISNHMGSKATEDERVMSIIFERMKRDDLYFLDSLVTNKSVCKALSRKMGLKFSRRSVFLDNQSDPEYIKGQIGKLSRQALATDWAIGVGHDRTLTIVTIKEMLPILRDAGIEVVPVSELVE